MCGEYGKAYTEGLQFGEDPQMLQTVVTLKVVVFNKKKTKQNNKILLLLLLLFNPNFVFLMVF